MNPWSILDEPLLLTAKVRIEILEILKSWPLMGKTVILCDHDLSDYEVYIDHMVELRDGQLKINKIPTSDRLLQRKLLLVQNYSIWIV